MISLGTGVSALGSSLAALATAATGQGLAATSSDTSVASVQNTGSASAGVYTLSNIASIATAASETSQTGYADSTTAPVSSAGNLSLVVGGKTIPISLTAAKNNLVGLRDAINALGAGVTASILTTGTGATPNYLSIQANNTGQTTLQLNDIPSGGGNAVHLLTSANQGTNAVFQLNGVNVNQASNVVNSVIPGVTFTLIAKPATANETVNLTLANNGSQFSSALQSFASNYNALVDQVNAQVGQSAGPLAGDFIVRQIQTDLQQTVSYYQGSGSVKGLGELGITLDTNGKMTFDPTVISAMSAATLSDAYKFIGTSTSGFGALASSFTQLSDPISGMMKIQEDGYDITNQNLTDQIAKVHDQVSRIEASWTMRLEAADAAVANLQSQQSAVTASVQSLNYVLYGKSTS